MYGVIVLLSVVSISSARTCPTGGKIFARGLSQHDIKTVLKIHNNYRLDIAHGRVPGQPRGSNLKRLKYDPILAIKATRVSNTCKFKHVETRDHRWRTKVGQNLFISHDSEFNITPDWKTAIKAWFVEHKEFRYPARSYGVTGHYKQMVNAKANRLGCDFIAYYDNTQPRTPYARLYTCNYGPGFISREIHFDGRRYHQYDLPPYKTGNVGCRNLC